jgi:hypothetical protein
MKKLALAAALALSAGPVSAQSFGPPAEPRFTVQETRQSFFTLQDAVRAVGDGRGTITIAPGRYEECAVQEEGQVTYVAAQPGRVIFDSVPCEQKAALVLRGRSAHVEGIVFQNLQVPDGNGAGIRIEKGDLTVRESLFRDSQSGILSASDPNGRIRIERSTFSGLGRCDGDLACAHAVYIGDYGALSIANSRFERGTGGHYVKSRTPRIEVVDSSFDDSGGRATNYMIDLSNGASGLIARNMFVQGANKENYSALITVGAEGQDNDSSGLLVQNNQAELAPEARRTSFVADLTGARLQIAGNRLAGQITELERRR